MNVASLFSLLMPSLVAVAARLGVRRPPRADRVRDARDALDLAGLLALQMHTEACPEVVTRILRDFRDAAGDAAREVRANARLIAGEWHAAGGGTGAARACFAAAAGDLEALADPGAAAALRVWLDAARAGIGDDADDRGAAALARAGEVDDPQVLIRLARLALWLGRGAQERGRWDEARARLEGAIHVGERVARSAAPAGAGGTGRERDALRWSLARGVAAAAAMHLGEVMASVGRSEEAVTWLDRAVATLEGADTPHARLALAQALVARARHETDEDLTRPGVREALLARSVEAGLASGGPTARAIAARAEIAIGAASARNGMFEEAAAHMRRAHAHLEGIEVPGVAEYVTEALLALGSVLEESGDVDGARAEFRRAFECGRADADYDARRLAVTAGCRLHRLLFAADAHAEAAALLDALEPLLPTLAAPARPLLSAWTMRCRAHQIRHDADAEAAMALFARAESLALDAPLREGADLARQLAEEQGGVAAGAERWAEAESHFRRALAMPSGAGSPAQEQAERAGTRFHLAQVLVRLEREAEGRAELRHAFELGRDSGRSAGRVVAALAAMMQADDPERTIGERRALLEAAARFGQLSRTTAGREVVEAAEQRLRDLTA